jgi:hypothetical protein
VSRQPPSWLGRSGFLGTPWIAVNQPPFFKVITKVYWLIKMLHEAGRPLMVAAPVRVMSTAEPGVDPSPPPGDGRENCIVIAGFGSDPENCLSTSISTPYPPYTDWAMLTNNCVGSMSLGTFLPEKNAGIRKGNPCLLRTVFAGE